MHRTTDRFWKCFEKLSVSIQKRLEQSFQLLKRNPCHPSLNFKKIGKFWSARAGISHRALAVEDGKDFTWVWIGTHDEYERMIRK